MARYTEQDIIDIHRTAKAKTGKKYYTFSGKVYIGLDTGHLQRTSAKELQEEKQLTDNTEDIITLDSEIVRIESKHDREIQELKCYALAMSIAL